MDSCFGKSSFNACIIFRNFNCVQQRKKFYEKIFKPLYVKTYEHLGLTDISLTTFHKIWKNFLIENKLTESDLGRFSVCQLCLRLKRSARLNMTSQSSLQSWNALNEHLEHVRLCRYCSKALESIAITHPDDALFIQFDRQDQQTTALPFFKT